MYLDGTVGWRISWADAFSQRRRDNLGHLWRNVSAVAKEKSSRSPHAATASLPRFHPAKQRVLTVVRPAECSITSSLLPQRLQGRGLPYMTSAKFSDFFTPPPCHIHNSRNLVPVVCFFGNPLPPRVRTSYMEALLVWDDNRMTFAVTLTAWKKDSESWKEQIGRQKTKECTIF